MARSLMHHDSGESAEEGMVNRRQNDETGQAKLRRIYIDCRYGQMHLVTAYPQSGGFDEGKPLLYLHGEGGSGAEFSRCAALLGVDRSVYAPDLPGSGQSDGPGGRPSFEQLSAGIGDLLEQLGLREVDVAGTGRGAQLALELAATPGRAGPRPVVTRLPPTPPHPGQAGSELPRGAGFPDGDAESVVAGMRDFLDRP